MDILLIRHGLPLRVESDRPVDPPLAPRGHEQAEALAAWLEPTPPDLLLSSTMNRAIDTAAHLGEAYELDTIEDVDFCEYDRGTTVYIPLEELERGDPHLEGLLDDWFGPAGADKRRAFRDRVVTALHRHIADTDAERVALVCHGGVINAVLSHVLDMDRVLFFGPAYTGVSRISWNDKRFRLHTVNESAHLRGLED